MRTLYHYPLDPASRQARIALGESKLKFKTETVVPWQPTEDFIHLCVEGVPPCLVEGAGKDAFVLGSSRAICEYAADGAGPRNPLLPDTPKARAESRRIANWLDTKFATDVNAYILSEKIEKTLGGHGVPDPAELRIGREHLRYHLEYFTWLLETRNWVAGRSFSLADIALGANISSLDYLGEISWEKWPTLQDWYQKVKCRPSFRLLLKDIIPGLRPPRHYADLDF